MNTKNKTIQIIAITTLISASSFAVSANESHSNHEMDHSMHKMDHSQMTHSNLSDEESIYICPMHPEVMSESPIKCPICGMSLEKTSFEEE